MSASNILYVEDSASDLWLFARACEAEGVEEPLYVVRDGVEAIAWLAGDGYFADRDKYPCPDLVLLDIQLQKVHGWEVLRWIRNHEPFAALPVVVFSALSRDSDIREAYSLGATLFLVKPSDLAGLRQVARLLSTWLRHGRPPPFNESLWGGFTPEPVAANLPQGAILPHDSAWAAEAGR